MRWISSKDLQREYGFSPAVSEKIIREQLVAVCRRGWRSWVLAACYLIGMFWLFFGVRWLVPSPFHNWHVSIVMLPGMLIIAARWFILPRLLAANAILASARAQAEGAHLEPDSAGQIRRDSSLA